MKMSKYRHCGLGFLVDLGNGVIFKILLFFYLQALVLQLRYRKIQKYRKWFHEINPSITAPLFGNTRHSLLLTFYYLPPMVCIYVYCFLKQN
ncbi:similar to RIKEN cDNA 1110059G10, isoform CRA_b [Rattus norvegicus]|uniref:Uncharacterized protein n=1 Tax=Rattus norvegicus TaxID=10116 RepID=A6I493_RAT|nr:similar to RIKEN cDNA 1110059G10, isoform CRA_b [Rattus norvegicus]